MKPKNLRRSDRVALTVPIQVSGTEITGQDFVEQARTLVISRYGATIVLNRKLAPVQQITIRCTGGDKEANARIVGQIGGQPNGYVYGVALLDPNVNLWGIGFPPLAESAKAVVRLLLECTACQTREVAYLNELEAEVFEANRSLSRSCKHCSEWTLWKQAFHEVPAEHDQPPARPDTVSASPPAPAPRTQNERRDIRIQLKMTACVRQPGFGEEVVVVEDVSRGGLRFISPNTYFAGSRIEVAVPYTAGSANIFVPARIVRFQELREKGLRKYGVAYIRTHQDRPGR